QGLDRSIQCVSAESCGIDRAEEGGVPVACSCVHQQVSHTAVLPLDGTVTQLRWDVGEGGEVAGAVQLPRQAVGLTVLLVAVGQFGFVQRTGLVLFEFLHGLEFVAAPQVDQLVTIEVVNSDAGEDRLEFLDRSLLRCNSLLGESVTEQDWEVRSGECFEQARLSEWIRAGATYTEQLGGFVYALFVRGCAAEAFLCNFVSHGVDFLS